MVTFPATEHHRPLAGTKLYCLVTEASRCQQLTQGCCAALPRVGFEPTTCWSQVQRCTCCAIEPPMRLNDTVATTIIRILLLSVGVSFVILCNVAGRVGGRPPSGLARGRSGGRHCMAGQYGYAPLRRHLVIIIMCLSWQLVLWQTASIDVANVRLE